MASNIGLSIATLATRAMAAARPPAAALAARHAAPARLPPLSALAAARRFASTGTRGEDSLDDALAEPRTGPRRQVSGGSRRANRDGTGGDEPRTGRRGGEAAPEARWEERERRDDGEIRGWSGRDRKVGREPSWGRSQGQRHPSRRVEGAVDRDAGPRGPRGPDRFGNSDRKHPGRTRFGEGHETQPRRGRPDAYRALVEGVPSSGDAFDTPSRGRSEDGARFGGVSDAGRVATGRGPFDDRSASAREHPGRGRFGDDKHGRPERERFGGGDRGRSERSRFGDDDRGRSERGRFGDDDRGRSERGRFGDDDRRRSERGRFGDDDRRLSERGRFGDDDRRLSERGRFGDDDRRRSERGRFGDDDRSPPRWGAGRQAYEETSPSSLKSLWKDDVVYGVNPVLAALTTGRREIHALYVQDGMGVGEGRGSPANLAMARARAAGVPTHRASKGDLNEIADRRSHQGLALDCSRLAVIETSDFPPPPAAWATSPRGREEGGEAKGSLEGSLAGVEEGLEGSLVGVEEGLEGAAGGAAQGQPDQTGGRNRADLEPLPVWLVLDEVKDPQNLGAIVRSAAYLGAGGVALCGKNCAPLSAAASKASAGALESLEISSIRSLPSALERAAQAGWRVLGADAGPGSVDAAEIGPTDRPTLLVLGSEGTGLRPLVRRACERLVRIDHGGTPLPPGLESLNVSVAAAILLRELLPRAAGGGVPATEQAPVTP